MTAAPAPVPAPLVAGDEAWCIVTEVSGKDRRTIVGAARVRVLDVGPMFRVEILLATTGGVVPGHKIDVYRRDLYACASPEEHRAFGADATRLWGSTTTTPPRK